MELDKLNEQINTLETERSLVLNELHTVQAKSVEIYNALVKLKDQRDTITYSAMTLENVDWEMLLSDNYSATPSKSNTLKKIMESLKNKYNLKYSGLTCEGTWVDTEQSAFKIGLIYNNPIYTQNVIKALEEVIPYIKPYKEDGYKHINIFEHNLSQYGSYHLVINEDGKAKIWKSSRYRNDDYKWNTLQETMAYIEQHLYYENPNGDEGEE